MGQPQATDPTKPNTIGDMAGAFQSIVTVQYIRGVKPLNWQPINGTLWQSNYWEHIIRDEQLHHRIAEYIINNPKNWHNDIFYQK
jgi:putative transposase